MTATAEAMGKVHELLVKDMLDRLENGAQVLDKDGCPILGDDGVVLRRPLVAAEWTAIAKFLKDNGIDSVAPEAPSADDPFAALIKRAAQSISSISN